MGHYSNVKDNVIVFGQRQFKIIELACYVKHEHKRLAATTHLM